MKMYPKFTSKRKLISIGEVRWHKALRTPQKAQLEEWLHNAHLVEPKGSPQDAKAHHTPNTTNAHAYSPVCAPPM